MVSYSPRERRKNNYVLDLGFGLWDKREGTWSIPVDRIESKTYSRTDVVLDDVIFVGCRFQDCGLVYNGGATQWDGCEFINCRLECKGSAFRTRQLLVQLGLATPESL